MEYEQEIEKLVGFVESMSDEEMNILLVSCMSSDTLYSEEACEKSLAAMDKLIVAIMKSNVSRKKKHSWTEHACCIKEIISNDYNLLKEEHEEE